MKNLSQTWECTFNLAWSCVVSTPSAKLWIDLSIVLRVGITRYALFSSCISLFKLSDLLIGKWVNDSWSDQLSLLIILTLEFMSDVWRFKVSNGFKRLRSWNLIFWCLLLLPFNLQDWLTTGNFWYGITKTIGLKMLTTINVY